MEKEREYDEFHFFFTKGSTSYYVLPKDMKKHNESLNMFLFALAHSIISIEKGSVSSGECVIDVYNKEEENMNEFVMSKNKISHNMRLIEKPF